MQIQSRPKYAFFALIAFYLCPSSCHLQRAVQVHASYNVLYELYLLITYMELVNRDTWWRLFGNMTPRHVSHTNRALNITWSWRHSFMFSKFLRQFILGIGILNHHLPNANIIIVWNVRVIFHLLVLVLLSCHCSTIPMSRSLKAHSECHGLVEYVYIAIVRWVPIEGLLCDVRQFGNNTC